MHITTTKQLKAALRTGPYAWPGGYPLYFIASDGAALSFQAVRDNFRSVLWSIRNKANDGWRVTAIDVNWEDICCEHTGERIPSAYGEDLGNA